MRSKEVDKNIIVFKTERDLLIGGHNLKTTDEYSRLNLAGMYTSILNYISELEEKYKQVNIDFTHKLIDEYISKQVIRDKLEELKNKEQELSDEQGYWGKQNLLDKIEILEEILGE